ncbi:glycosyltransferase family 9 protein [Thermosporothrix hazakensis]|jgi:hypothetical protein|nr:glycosyltransferase family 9 protein [Thermosporothrix hazakensis]
MSFMHEWALDKGRRLKRAEKIILSTINRFVYEADHIVISVGGKAGRLGESVVATALVEAVMQALRYAGKAGTPVTILVDEGAASLFNEQLYQKEYWQGITVVRATIQPEERRLLVQEYAVGETVLVLDFDGANDELPKLQVLERDEEDSCTVAILDHLFRVGIRSYAHRGPVRRYVDFVEELFDLPDGILNGLYAQPQIRLSTVEEQERYQTLVKRYTLNPDALRVVCFFQTVVIAKCYCRWDEVMQLLCEHVARAFPGKKVEFIIVCGPDEIHPDGMRRADFLEEYQGFRGVDQNARVLVVAPDSLRDLAILAKQADLALSNDTGPGHIAGALQVPTVTPYLPGNVYSRKVWASSLWHEGVTLEPSPYSFEQIRSAVLWDRTTIIDSIPPEELVSAALASLPEEWRVENHVQPIA